MSLIYQEKHVTDQSLPRQICHWLMNVSHFSQRLTRSEETLNNWLQYSTPRLHSIHYTTLTDLHLAKLLVNTEYVVGEANGISHFSAVVCCHDVFRYQVITTSLWSVTAFNRNQSRSRSTTRRVRLTEVVKFAAPSTLKSTSYINERGWRENPLWKRQLDRYINHIEFNWGID